MHVLYITHILYNMHILHNMHVLYNMPSNTKTLQLITSVINFYQHKIEFYQQDSIDVANIKLRKLT